MKTREIVTRYYLGWVDGDRDRVRSLLADDLLFRSPQDAFERADDFLGACWKLSEGFDEYDVQHAVYDEDGAYVVYRIGEFGIGELLKLQDGKIAEIYVTFDPTR